MSATIKLHDFVANELEYKALAWSSLAWYWGLSFCGTAPKYYEYMNDGSYEVDKAFYGDNNESINHIIGYDRPLTPSERFNRAVNFYEHCVIQGKRTAINPPWDEPPTIDDLIAFRGRMEAKPQAPNTTIDASVNNLLQNEDFAHLWQIGGALQREETARRYAIEVKHVLDRVRSDLIARFSLTLEQLNKDTAFLDEGSILDCTTVLVDQMDEAMPEDAQYDKLGDVYTQKLLNKSETDLKIITLGIAGRYYNAGHNLERAMWNPQAAQELSYAHHMTVMSWNQIMHYIYQLKQETNDD